MRETILISTLTLASIVAYKLTFYLVANALLLPTQDLVIPIGLKDPSSLAEVPTVISNLQRRATTELFRDKEIL